MGLKMQSLEAAIDFLEEGLRVRGADLTNGPRSQNEDNSLRYRSRPWASSAVELQGECRAMRRLRLGGRVIRCRVISTASISLNFWVKEVGQTGTMATTLNTQTTTLNTQNGRKCCDSHSPFKSTVHKGCNFACSIIITQIARRRCRRRRMIRVPRGMSKPPGRGTWGVQCRSWGRGGGGGAGQRVLLEEDDS